MTRRRLGLVIAVFLIGLICGLTASAWTAERHPQSRAAMRDLASAQMRLEHADHDFGGHRVKAIGHIDKAQDELRKALDFDK